MNEPRDDDALRAMNPTMQSVLIALRDTLTLLMLGIASTVGATFLLDVEDIAEFLAWFVLLPLGSICFGLTTWRLLR
jgi:hypothetical protein